jgi:carbamoyl-phosphate synthase large subunit
MEGSFAGDLNFRGRSPGESSKMPPRSDIKKVLIIGAGPIVIGQACEFDYSGVQALKALRSVGMETVLVNSNPATIMTEPKMADHTYVEPLTLEFLTRILEYERPDAILPTLGGQTALNLAMDLARSGVLDRLSVELIGATPEVIHKAEDRSAFKELAQSIGLSVPRSVHVSSLPGAREAVRELGGFPVILRPSYTMGGAGGNIAYNQEEYDRLVLWALAQSPVHQVLVEQSVLGWKEYELEVMRDKADNVVIVCSIENLDPMGVHTGDSITVAPQQTLTDREYQRMRDAAIDVIRAIGVDTGGANVQFAVDPVTGDQIVIEMNPRVSRSSALASKATGYPIAKIAALVAVGMTLDEITNDITGKTPACFEPTIDYVVTKIPRFTFEKFPEAESRLGPQMKSVGESMAIGRSFSESFQKALRSLEIGRVGLDPVFVKEQAGRVGFDVSPRDVARIERELANPGSDRIWAVGDAFRVGLELGEVQRLTGIDPWFLRQIQSLVQFEQKVRIGWARAADRAPGEDSMDPGLLRQAKRLGFSDARLAQLTSSTPDEVMAMRKRHGILPVFKLVDTCAAEFEAETPYHYSCYDAEDERLPSKRERVVILGGGPNRIGQGIEFDCCCVMACFGLREAGFEPVMVNCNPETVSTDWDVSDRLYFEPITLEDVLAVIEREEPLGVMLQFGGQTPLKLAADLERHGVKILGTTPEQIERAENRESFSAVLEKIGVRRIRGRNVRDMESARRAASEIGYPLIVRPSFVLGGRAMVIVHEAEDFEKCLVDAFAVSDSHPLLIEEFLDDAIEVDVDVLGDGQDFIVAGVMEHVEEAGVHSGDSACALPPFSLPGELEEQIRVICRKLAKELGIVGLMNVQLAVREQDIYVLEVNPRASRTVPFVSKVMGLPLAHIAAQVMTGATLAELGIREDPVAKMMAVKEVVFPFDKFRGTDVLLGPEMKSTGEVIALDRSFPLAFAKAQIAVGMAPPQSGTVFISVRDKDKEKVVPVAQALCSMGFSLIATRGTAAVLVGSGINVKSVNKVTEGRPHCVDHILSGDVQLVINTTVGAQSIRDSKSLREAGLRQRIPYVTTMAAAVAITESIRAMKSEAFSLPPTLQRLHRGA